MVDPDNGSSYEIPARRAIVSSDWSCGSSM
jgi:hypothetical protein